MADVRLSGIDWIDNAEVKSLSPTEASVWVSLPPFKEVGREFHERCEQYTEDLQEIRQEELERMANGEYELMIGLPVSPEFKECLRDFSESLEERCTQILDAMQAFYTHHYKALWDAHAKYTGEENLTAILPPPDDRTSVNQTIRLVLLIAWGRPELVFKFNCAWEQEHGVEVHVSPGSVSVEVAR